MKRRSFLKGLAALPLLPGVLRDWAWERAEALPEPEPKRTVPADLLGAAIGSPLALTVVVPPGRTLRISSRVCLTEGGQVYIREDHTVIGTWMTPLPHQVLELEAVRQPTPGCHTYRVEATSPLLESKGLPNSIMVRDITVVDILRGVTND